MTDSPSSARAVPERGLAFVTSRPVAITMFMIAIAVFGLVSLGKLPMDLLPEISYPTLTVRSAWPGAAPEDVEDRISMRIQETLSTLSGLVRTSSVSRAGFSDVALEYEWGSDMTFAVQEVRDKLDSLFLPEGAERPLILRYDPNLDPILRIGVTHARAAGDAEAAERDLIHVRWMAENRIERELESVPGVAAVQVRGGLEEEIRVRVDPHKLAAQALDPNQIAQRLAAENLNASGGVIREGSTEYLVRTLNEFQTIEDIQDLPVVARGDAVIRIRDVAEVTRTHKKREVVTRLDGGEAVEIAIYREAGSNIVDVASTVKERVFGTAAQREHTSKLDADGRPLVEEGGEQRAGGPGPGGPAGGGRWEDRELENYLEWRLRKDVRLEMLSDQSTFIRSAIDDVKQSAVFGALLAIGVLWFFLKRLSATFIVALSIPISVIVTFAPMFLLDVSLNIMSLGGLALGVGMLVDNAIVVLESITRCREEGDDLRTAAVRGVREVAGAITASTLTTVAVFAPIVFVHGIAGQMFGDQAVTVVSSLLVSLLVAVLFIPMLASRTWLAGGDAARADGDVQRPPRVFSGLRWSFGTFAGNLLTIAGRLALVCMFGFLKLAAVLGFVAFKLVALLLWPIGKVFDLCWRSAERAYVPLLSGSLRHPLVVIVAILLLGWFAYRRVSQMGVELLPEIHQGEFTAHVGFSVESPLANTDRVMRAIDERVRDLPGIEVTALTVGVEQDTLSRDIEGEHTARLTVRLEPAIATAELEERVLGEVRSMLEDHPEVRSVDVTRPTPFTLDAPVAVEVRGHELPAMESVAQDVLARMARVPELEDVRSTVRPGHPEARVVFDRDKTLEFGLDLNSVSTLVRNQLLGNVSTRFVEGDERIDIRVQGDEAYLGTLDEVLDLAVNPAAATPVPLNAIARVELVRGPAEIRRIGNSRAVVLTATGTGLDLGGLNRKLERELGDLVTPEDVFVEMGGQKRELEEGSQSMRFALLLAIFLVYVVMACQFESLVQPLIIMLTVPLAAVGVIFTLDVLAIPLSVVVFIGLILLAGIVVNNAIVLVDRINQKRDEGLELHAAIVEAGHARLRPIMMTTATTVLGLLPMTGWLEGLPLVGDLGAGEGAEMRAPMAVTVIAGLASSTLLTLVAIPVVYSLVVRRWRVLPTRSTAEASA